MSTKSMIRKQLYITREQDRALKQQAQVLGVSEAELVRRALDEHVRGGDAPSLSTSARQKVLDELIENTRRLAGEHRLPAGFRFDRDDLYERGS